MKKLTVILIAFIGCVYVAPYPPDWGPPSDQYLSGAYLNTGITDPKSEKRGFNAYRLQSLFWYEPNFNADIIKIDEEGSNFRISALAGNEVLSELLLAKKEGVLSFERLASTKSGDPYKAIYKFFRTRSGLVADVDIISGGIFFIPMVGRDRIWILYHAAK